MGHAAKSRWQPADHRGEKNWFQKENHLLVRERSEQLCSSRRADFLSYSYVDSPVPIRAVLRANYKNPKRRLKD